MLLRENEKYKNDLRANRKNMYTAAANTSNYQAAMVGTKILGQMGSFASKLGGAGGVGASTNATGISAGFAGTVFGKGADGSATDRSTYLNKDSGVDKSFVSTGGGGLLGSNFGSANLGGGNTSSYGAVGGISGMGTGGLDSSLLHNNILSTPSSEKSHGRSSAFSPNDQ